MANWTNVNVNKDENEKVRVVSHERIEDTNPDTYLERGKYFLGKGKYADAEREYLKAVKFSGKDRQYVYSLMRFYYANNRKEYGKKADRLYKDYHKNERYIIWCIICIAMAYAGLSGNSMVVLINYVPYLLSGFVYFSIPKVKFKHIARGKSGNYILKVIFSGFLFLVMEVTLLMFIYNGGEFLNKIFEIQENGIVLYGGLMFGAVALVSGIVTFNKIISEFQKNVKKKGLIYKGSKVVRVIAMVGCIFWATYLIEEIDFGKVKEYNEPKHNKVVYEQNTHYDNQDIDYLSLSEWEQKEKIASYVGCNVDNLIFYINGKIGEKDVAMYEYVDDYGGASDYMIVLFKDGTIWGYYPDGTFRDVEGMEN